LIDGGRAGEVEVALTVDLTSAHVLRVGQFGRRVGIAPVTVGVMRFMTIAAIVGTTVDTEVEMIGAKILITAEA